MKVILLAAGYGTRLLPLTANTPKALLLIKNTSILDRILTDLQGFDCNLITNNKFYTSFKEHARNKYTVINDNTNSNDDRLGAVGDIMFIINNQKINEDVLIVNTDNLFGFNLKTFIDYAETSEHSVAACKDMQSKEAVKNRFGVIVEEQGVITEFQEKPNQPQSTLAPVGLYYIKKKDLPFIAECAQMSADNTGDMIKHLVHKSTVNVWTFTHEWSDVGTPESYEHAQNRF